MEISHKFRTLNYDGWGPLYLPLDTHDCTLLDICIYSKRISSSQRRTDSMRHNGLGRTLTGII